jgi:hypothetical protein
MGISSTGSRMASRRRMHMIVLVDLMRVYGGSLGRTISQAFVFWVRLLILPFAAWLFIAIIAENMAVTHGLMSRVFLMKWYHFSVEYFEDLRNVNHCEFLIMRKKEDSGKYILENKLRTWSELKRERAAAAAAAAAAVKDKAKEDSDKEKDLSKADRLEKSITHGTPVSAIPKRKQWGGCPNGCDHGRHFYRKENSMHAMQANGRASEPASAITPTTSASNTPIEAPPIRRPFAHRFQSSSEDEEDPRGRLAEKAPPAIDVQKSLQNDGVPDSASLDSTPSSMPTEERLKLRGIKSSEIHLVVAHLGRDFGGSKSGNTSRAGSDSEAVEGGDEGKDHSHGHNHGHPKGQKGVLRKKDKGVAKRRGKGEWHGESGMGRGAKADALGDQSDVGSDGGSEREDGDGENHTGSGDEMMCQEEIEGKSFRGSVL